MPVEPTRNLSWTTPQGKDRWNKQAGFFVENLKYEHSSGRQSVMELLHQLLSKLGDETLEQLGFTFFVRARAAADQRP